MQIGPASYHIADRSFVDLIEPDASVERVATGCLWAEGPVWRSATRSLVFSDVRRNRLLHFDEESSLLSYLRQPSDYSNGNTNDLDGRLITCEHGLRRVVRTEDDGSRTVIADSYEGHRFNSPNDVVVTADSAVWFTDPTYGIDSFDEGFPAESETDGCNVYRVAPDGSIAAVVTDMVRPNGLAFSPDESVLYVADTGFSHVPDGPRHIRRYDIADGCVVGGGEIFASCRVGCFDGFRVDDDGNVWASTGEGVSCYRPDGRLLGAILLPEVCANLEFGGQDGRTLYMTATTSLYRTRVAARGATFGR